MSTNWKSVVGKINSEVYVLPDGWTSREDIAKELECSEDRVDDNLRAGLKSGRFIKQQHKVWNEKLLRCTLVIAYHDTASDTKAKPAPINMEIIKSMKASGKTWTEIGVAIGRTRDSARSIFQRAK